MEVTHDGHHVALRDHVFKFFDSAHFQRLADV
jgi:hypothetical protein